MTHIPRPRLWLAASLAALSLMVFVSLKARRSDAQDKPETKPSAASETPVQKPADSADEKAPSKLTLLLGDPEPGSSSRRFIFIEISPDERSEVVHKIVDELVKAWNAKKLTADATQTAARADYTATISVRADLKFERIEELVKSLQQLGVAKVQFGQTDENNSVRVIAPPHLTAESLQELRAELAKYEDFEADVLVPTVADAVPIAKRLTEIQKALTNCSVVVVMILDRSLRLSIFENTDKSRLAEAIFAATKSDDNVTLFVKDKSLLIQTAATKSGQADLETGGKIAQTVIVALMGGADDANTTIPGGAVGGGFGGSPMLGGGLGRGGLGRGGLGGSGLGGGGGANQSSQSTIVFPNDVVMIPKEAIGSPQLVYSGHIAIAPSKQNDMLWGYSEPLGQWVKQPVSLDVGALIPIVGAHVAAIQPIYKTKPDKMTYFAFSSATGRWGPIEVSLNASVPIVYAKMVVVTDGETTHVFKNDTGKWSTPTALVADDVSPVEPKPSLLSKMPAPPRPHAPPYLKYSDGQEVYLVDLDSDGVLDVVPADETKSSRLGEDHSIVGAWQMVRETAAKRREVAEERAALQESLGPKHPALAQISGRLARLEEDEQEWRSRLKAFTVPTAFGRVTVIDWQSRLKSELQQAERDSEQAARAMKAEKKSGDKDQAQSRLREAVVKAFSTRQMLQQLEAELLRERLRQVDDRLQERGRLRDRIIERRVEELTNSNLDWGASEPSNLSNAGGSQPNGLVSQPPDLPFSVETFRGLLYFESPTKCAECQKLNPLISKLENEGLAIRRIDADQPQNLPLIKKYQVDKLPAFICCRGGNGYDRIRTRPISEGWLRIWIDDAQNKRESGSAMPRTTAPLPPDGSTKPFQSPGGPSTPPAEAVHRHPTDAVAIVNDEPITYRNLVCMGLTLNELEVAINFILLIQAAEKANISISEDDLDAEVQRMADERKLSLDECYSMIGKDRGIGRERCRETVAWPPLVLTRLAGDDIKQHPKFLAGLRAAAKIELVDPDAKLRPVNNSAEPLPPSE